MTAPAIYVAAVAAANLSAAIWGPAITPINALLFIGLDLSLRDRLHDRWRDWRKMALLIAAGGAASWLVQPTAGRIALASTAAFVISASLDAATYEKLRHRKWMVRANASNTVGAAADSLLFPTLAFGALLPAIIAGQFVAKTAGGAIWAAILRPDADPALKVG